MTIFEISLGKIGWTSGIVSTWQVHQIQWIPNILVHNLQIRPGESTKFTSKPWEKWVEKESRAKAGTHGLDI